MSALPGEASQVKRKKKLVIKTVLPIDIVTDELPGVVHLYVDCMIAGVPLCRTTWGAQPWKSMKGVTCPECIKINPHSFRDMK